MTTREALRDYFSRENKDKKIEYLANFTGVTRQTVKTWIIEKFFPVGLVLLKLRFFLEKEGYKIEELEALKRNSPWIYGLAKLLAYNLVSPDEATKQIGFANIQETYRLVIYGQKTSTGRQKLIENFCKRYLKEEVKEEVVVRPRKEETPSLKNEEVIKITANLISALLPLTALLVERFSPEERRKLRQMVEGNGVFHLSNFLNALCGETARSLIKQRS